ncbi:hypothetical protein BABA_25926 [Neobacillus bataviensis LMG 21833]|uniref:Uncharacterized protein n=1 Tax=Neobacillus bataviensis LMG 21833 TaxID=1117379 RepID=K6CQA8_9BACI|nr:hypothetical protein [Neobacillus bataviensis]EKN62452.1 hypothetical protein BABA_25926 [Neobacillus bataviensis LMG 21833]
MYPYQSPYLYRNQYQYPVQDQRFIGFGWPLAIGGLGFLGGLIGGGLAGGFVASRPFYGGYPPMGYPAMGYPPMGYPGYY